MIDLIKQLFQIPRLDLREALFKQQSPSSSGEVDVLGYRVRNYKDAGKLGGYVGVGIGSYLGATTYGLIPGLLTGVVGGFILGALGGLGIYGLYRLYKRIEREIPRGHSQPA